MENKLKKRGKFLIISFVLYAIATFAAFRFIIPENNLIRKENVIEISYPSFMKAMEDSRVDTVYYSQTAGNIIYITKEGNYYNTGNPATDTFKQELLENDIIVKPLSEYKTANDAEAGRRNTFIVFTVLYFAITVIFFAYGKVSKEKFSPTIVNKKKKVAQGHGAVSASTAKKEEQPDANVKKFSDIAGLYEVKKDISCLVDFLVNNEKYVEAGAKLPKGIILYGPPGTGKTLLAKAIAGEANVPFVYMSGSEFVEMYVGVGAKRVRELFEKARKQAPCIVFIDEIDAIGAKRHEGENSEDRKTLNALLTEMDGFKPTDNIIVIGATNRIEDLDSALTRPGRFTNKFCVPVPETVKERLEIIDLYTKDKKIGDDLDFNAIAKETVGFSPAKIEALLNEAAIISVQEDRGFIDKEIVDKAMYKILLQGHAKENQDERDKEELRIVAWHEAGHAVVGKTFGKDITKVTIVSSTSGAGGVTFSTPTKTSLLSQIDMQHEVMELYGGRLAELIYFNGDKEKVTTGASNDIERATQIIRDYVTKYGFTEQFGMLDLRKSGVDKEYIVKREIELAKELEQKTHELLTERYDLLKDIAEQLIKNETIYSNEINDTFVKYNFDIPHA